MKALILPIAAASLLVASCAQDTLTGDTYSRGEAGRGQTVEYGKIVSIRNVKIEGDHRAGTVAGGVAGGFLGREIGSGRAANTAGTIGGALAGAAIGSAVEQGLSSRAGIEITVRLDQGGDVAVVQEVNPRETFRVGERVRVLSGGGRTRVTH